MEPSRPVIAVVEDDASLAVAIERLLRAAGFAPVLFRSAELFLQHARPETLACLVLDLHLPGMSGFELAGRLAREACLLPVVVVTGDDSAATRAQAALCRNLGFLLKPFDSNELIAAIRCSMAAGPERRAEGAPSS